MRGRCRQDLNPGVHHDDDVVVGCQVQLGPGPSGASERPAGTRDAEPWAAEVGWLVGWRAPVGVPEHCPLAAARPPRGGRQQQQHRHRHDAGGVSAGSRRFQHRGCLLVPQGGGCPRRGWLEGAPRETRPRYLIQPHTHPYMRTDGQGVQARRCLQACTPHSPERERGAKGVTRVTGPAHLDGLAEEALPHLALRKPHAPHEELVRKAVQLHVRLHERLDQVAVPVLHILVAPLVLQVVGGLHHHHVSGAVAAALGRIEDVQLILQQAHRRVVVLRDAEPEECVAHVVLGRLQCARHHLLAELRHGHLLEEGLRYVRPPLSSTRPEGRRAVPVRQLHRLHVEGVVARYGFLLATFAAAVAGVEDVLVPEPQRLAGGHGVVVEEDEVVDLRLHVRQRLPKQARAAAPGRPSAARTSRSCKLSRAYAHPWAASCPYRAPPGSTAVARGGRRTPPRARARTARGARARRRPGPPPPSRCSAPNEGWGRAARRAARPPRACTASCRQSWGCGPTPASPAAPAPPRCTAAAPVPPLPPRLHLRPPRPGPKPPHARRTP
eukprot:scaffold492_cov347-Prasinococcus_capsulatus_cf.AAC.5